MSKLSYCLLAGVCLLPVAARAQQATNLPPIEVTAGGDAQPAATPRPTSTVSSDDSVAGRRSLNVSIVTRAAIATQAPRTNDTARLLEDTPGVSLYGAGAISSLPVIHGLEDDRNNVVLGGVPITAACANHMNPPLSYIDPVAIGQVEVLTVNVPVSKGGDSIGGSILVTPRPPVFVTPVIAKGPASAPAFAPFGPGVLVTGSLSTYFRSNGGGIGVSGHINMATEHFSLQYDGAWSKSGDYYAGGGDKVVRSTLYEASNQAATLAYSNDGQTLAFHYAHQWIPYQGFPNQWMDMLGNNGNTYDLSYKGAFGWGALEANAFYHLTQHYMNFLADKNGGVSATPDSGMPMYVNNQDYGYRIKATINLGEADLLRVGNELHMETM
ncbi:MAG TPA: TonB-dependent receptor plug domain-containing protein, partial [Rhodoblastus sp.]|nr:TonB-dependent receptor plug domain-containing protein [Rhodoblastus sp.]